MTEPTQIDWARMAAYIDGEGTILIRRIKAGENRKRQGQDCFSLGLTITNADVRLVEWCKNVFGGGNTLHPVRKPHHSQCFNWQTSCANAARILKGCLPYFIVKREQAEIALAFQRTMGKIGVRISAETLATRNEFRIKLQSLHRTVKSFDPSGSEWRKPKSPPGRKPWKNVPNPEVALTVQ